MRVTTLAGIALVVVGAFLLIRGGTFTTRREVLNVGGLKVTAEEQQPILPWVAGLAVVAGIALTVTGARRKA